MSVLVVGSIWVCSLFLTAGLAWLAGRRSWMLLAAGGNSHVRGLVNQGTVTPPLPMPKKRRRSHVFDGMPPVEAVRAQAKTILRDEAIWNSPKIRAQLSAEPERHAVAWRGRTHEMVWAMPNPMASLIRSPIDTQPCVLRYEDQSCSSSTRV
ncbi:MAG: hypothetical protein ABJ205_07880 [Erythrobacter sp.]|uniref:hypothetical protein n=1 Tax=Erythrobacter sp. TaxID=1042 RepID=UPI0032656706